MAIKSDNERMISCIFCGHITVVSFDMFVEMYLKEFSSEDTNLSVVKNSSEYFYNIYISKNNNVKYICEQCLDNLVYDAESMEVKHKLGIL